MRAEVGIFGAFEDGPQDVVITVSGEEPHSVEFGGLVDVGGHVLGQAAGSRVFEGGRVQVLQPQLLCLLQEDGSQCGDGLCLGDRCVGSRQTRRGGCPRLQPGAWDQAGRIVVVDSSSVSKTMSTSWAASLDLAGSRRALPAGS